MKKYLVGVFVFVGLWVAPRVSEACSCAPSVRVLPGSVLPENGVLLLQESCGTVLDRSVLVDGAPASLVPGVYAELSASGEFYAIEPAPTAGQTVTVSVTEDISPREVVLTVGAPDDTPPSLSEPSVTITPNATRACGAESTQTKVRVELEDEQADGATEYTMEVFLDGVFVGSGSSSGDVSEGSVTLSTNIDPGGSEICVEVSAVDVAGNVDASDSVCKPADEAAGCSCSTQGGSAWAILPVLLLGIGFRRRARRRRGPSST